MFPKVTSQRTNSIELKELTLEKISQEKTCPPSQFNDLIRYVLDKTLLLLRDMSSSMDLMYLYSQALSLSFQCKDTEKEPSWTNIGMEMGKVPFSTTRMDVLVMVCMNITKDFLPYVDSLHGFTTFIEGKYCIFDDKYLVRVYNNVQTHIYLQDGVYPLILQKTGIHYQKEGKPVFLCYGFETSKQVFPVRKNMQLVFLQEKGVRIGGREYIQPINTIEG
jgi:hypothetical protein